MSKHFFVSLACLLGLTLAACDSQSQLTAARGGPAPVTVNATESITYIGSGTPTIAYSFTSASLPVSVASGSSNLALVLGGYPVPLVAAGPDWIANLPPTARPPVPDSTGQVALLLQSDSGSAVVDFKITPTPPQVFGPPNSTFSAAVAGGF